MVLIFEAGSLLAVLAVLHHCRHIDSCKFFVGSATSFGKQCEAWRVKLIVASSTSRPLGRVSKMEHPRLVKYERIPGQNHRSKDMEDLTLNAQTLRIDYIPLYQSFEHSRACTPPASRSYKTVYSMARGGNADVENRID